MLNLSAIIRPALLGTACRAYPLDMNVVTLSTGTASVDTGDKLDEYQTIAELEEYVLIDSRKSSVRIYRRDGETLKTDPATIKGSIELRSLGLRTSLAEIYEDVDFERAHSERSGGPVSNA